MAVVHVCLVYLLVCVAGILCCPNGWVSFDGSCYYVSDIQEDWPTASAACRNFHAGLVEIDNKYEDNFVAQLARAHHATHPSETHYWLDGSDAFVEGDWRWVESGIRIGTRYSNWRSGEPNDRYGEDCLVLHSQMNFRWDDISCNLKCHFICETMKGWVPIG